MPQQSTHRKNYIVYLPHILGMVLHGIGVISAFFMTHSRSLMISSVAVGIFLSGVAVDQEQREKTTLHAIVLPIEVMGEGDVETVMVDIEDASNIASLWMQVHNLSYDEKGSIKINEGPWISLRNNTVDMAFPESHIGGIGGGYSTIRFSVPLTGSEVAEGRNSVSFRFNKSDGISSGWRVLAFNLKRSDGSIVLPESTFFNDDPTTWQPIRDSSDELADGRALWYQASLNESPGGSQIKASCNDCHAENARDLKYFNYSNKSIIERSKFHGLSEEQGEQIASWVRSLAFPAPGRPWNPPYQPGPGLDDKPVEEWAAGAGIEWVLDRDEESLPYLFPEGVTSRVASTKSTLNLRELPLALQFPDWNRWLPLVHPIDFWGDSFEDSDAWDAFTRDVPASIAGIDVADPALIGALRSFDSAVTDWRRNAHVPSGKTPQEHATGNLSLQLWHLVKVWDVMQTYHLEDHGDEFYERGEKRTWISESRNIFNVAPHISSAPGASTYGSESLDKFFSHTWYMYQLVLNPGNREPLGHRPVDWKYQFGHIGDYTKHTNLESGVRLVASYIKMIQMLDNEKGINDLGWYIRHAHPYWFVRSLATEPGKANTDIWGSIPEELYSPIAEALIRSFLRKTLEYEVSEWPRGEDFHQLEPVSYTPVPHDGRGDIFEDRLNYADNFYRMIPEFLERGVGVALMDSLATWGESVWPTGDWQRLIDEYEASLVLGDVTGDGTVSALDASYILRHAGEITDLEGSRRRMADVSGDTTISAYDAALVLRYIAGLIDCFPIDNRCIAS